MEGQEKIWIKDKELGDKADIKKIILEDDFIMSINERFRRSMVNHNYLLTVV
ncbi:MAG TPA: hypothetical protein VIY08_08810 [Candidatus Nitrosocosmicus sp.]